MALIKNIILFTALILLFASLLELLSLFAKCEPPPKGDRSLFAEHGSDPEAVRLLSELRDKRLTDEKISKQEYRTAFEEVITEVDAKQMGSWFGVTPSLGADIGFVRNNLPYTIKLLVKRHELEHLLQTGKEKNKEWSANWAVFREYPLESPLMLIFATKDRLIFYRGRPLCLLVNLWDSFKRYLLPMWK